ncbi:MAG: glycerol-3-phosphate acyltransferase [Verrucomicrobia bacterium]|nr:glycerol-3-phosphate acyltransferase [Verrucomicrobiota bacterium]
MASLAEISAIHIGYALTVFGACYALGCITLGYYLVWMTTGQDVRQSGSGNVGARNVSRTLGPWAFAVTLAWDMGKGGLAVWGTERVNSGESLKCLAMLAVVAGHIWPAQLRFRGGKGMATAAGAAIALNPWAMVGPVALFIPLVGLLKSTTLAGLVAFTSLPFVSGFLRNSGWETLGFALLAALVLFAHRTNIREELAALAAARKNRTGSSRSQETPL